MSKLTANQRIGLFRVLLAARAQSPLEHILVRRSDERGTGTRFTVVTGEGCLDELLKAEPDLEFAGWVNGADHRVAVGLRREDRPPSTSPPSSFRVIAVVPVYDEADILDRTIAHLVENGVEVYIIDNWSVDGCAAIAESWRGRGVVGIEKFPADGPSDVFDWTATLATIPRIGRESGADWTIFNDADEIRRSPWNGVNLRDGIWQVDAAGYNCINLTLLNFQLTTGLPPAGRDATEYLSYFRPARVGDLTQTKIWKNVDGEIDIHSTGGHTIRMADRKVFPYNFLQLHYPYRSEAQARAKIEDRLRRQSLAERRRGWGAHLMTEKSAVVSTENLIFYPEPSFDVDWLLERLSGIGWRLEVELPKSLKHRAARVLKTIGIWPIYANWRQLRRE